MKLLIDTHIWIWALAGSAQLPERFQDTLASHRGGRLSPISVWDTLVLAGRGRMDLKTDPVRWVREALKRRPINEAPLNMIVAIRSEEVDLPRRDAADRFIDHSTRLRPQLDDPGRAAPFSDLAAHGLSTGCSTHPSNPHSPPRNPCRS